MLKLARIMICDIGRNRTAREPTRLARTAHKAPWEMQQLFEPNTGKPSPLYSPSIAPTRARKANVVSHVREGAFPALTLQDASSLVRAPWSSQAFFIVTYLPVLGHLSYD